MKSGQKGTTAMSEVDMKKRLTRYLRRVQEFIRHYGGGLYRRFDEHHIFLAASGLSFSVFLCIIPMVLIIFSALGFLLTKPSIVSEVGGFIDRFIPYQEYATQVKEIVFSRVHHFTLYRNMAGWIGAIGLLFAASGLFSSMRTILDMVYGIQRRGSMLIGKLRDLGLVFLVLIFLLLATAILPGLGIAKGLSHEFLFLKWFQWKGFQDIIFRVTSFLLMGFAFSAVYLTVPHRRLPPKAIIVSAFWAAVMWYAAERLFRYYITNLVSFKQVYGTYSFMVVVAFWIYYTSIIFILGAEIGQLYRERHYSLTDRNQSTSAA